jgi:hypothetical protein
MVDCIRELKELGIDVIDPVHVEGELRFKSRAIDRLGPSELNRKLVEAYDDGRITFAPWNIYVSTAA